MEELLPLVSLLLSKGGFSSLSSAVKVVCPFYTKGCFVLGLFFCLSRDIKNIRGACGVFWLWGWGNTFLFVTSLLLMLWWQIWRKSLILGEKCQSNNLDLLSAGKGEMYVPGHYERNQSCPTGRSTAETRNEGRNAASSMEEGSADAGHRKVSSVTTHEVHPLYCCPQSCSWLRFQRLQLLRN